MKKRDVNFEILRILGMLFIIGMHYLDKGGLMKNSFNGGMTAYDMVVRIIEAFLVCGVNVYVLIGAYFLCDKEYSTKRVLRIWGITVFYSILIGLVHMVVCSIIGQPFPLDKYGIFNLVFPIISEHYWFVSVYVVLVIIGPMLNQGLNKLAKSYYIQVLTLLTVILSISVTIIPLKLPIDGFGMNILWFILLYMYGAYIKKYGIPLLETKFKPIILYIAAVLCIVMAFIATEKVYELTGSLGDFITRQYHYNSFFCLIASIALFYCFKNMQNIKIKGENLLLSLAGVSFGVYLIHEHILLRYEWPKALRITDLYGNWMSLLLFVPVVLFVYLVCGIIELLRQKLFSIFGKIDG